MILYNPQTVLQTELGIYSLELNCQSVILKPFVLHQSILLLNDDVNLCITKLHNHRCTIIIQQQNSLYVIVSLLLPPTPLPPCIYIINTCHI